MRVVVTKPHRPDQLLDELNANPDLAPQNGSARTSLLSNGDRIQVEFPDGVAPATVEAIIAAHNPKPRPAPINYGNDGSTPDQLSDAIANLRQYLGLATPTQAQSTMALKLVIRVLLFILRRLVN